MKNALIATGCVLLNVAILMGCIILKTKYPTLRDFEYLGSTIALSVLSFLGALICSLTGLLEAKIKEIAANTEKLQEEKKLLTKTSSTP